MLRTNALSLSIAPTGQQVDLATGTPIAPNTFPTGQGSQNVIIGKSGGEANLFGNIPGKGYGIDVTVSLATRINSIFRIQDQDVFDTPLLVVGQPVSGRHLQLPPDLVRRGAELHPGYPSDGQPAHLACHHQGRQAAHRQGGGQHQPARPRRAVCVPDAVHAVQQRQPGRLPGHGWCRWPGLDACGPDVRSGNWRHAVAGDDRSVLVLPYNSNQLPVNIANTTALARQRRRTWCATPSRMPIIRDSSLYGSVEPMVAASAANGYTTTASGAQATVAGDIICQRP